MELYSLIGQLFSSKLQSTSSKSSSQGKQATAPKPNIKNISMDQWGTTIGGGIANGLDEYFKAKGQQYQYESQALQYDSQAAIASLNASMLKDSYYATGRQYEYQGMMKGLQSAQQISNTRARTASRGVRLNQGSAAEVEASQRIAARMDQLANNYNRVAAMNQVRSQIASAEMTARTAAANAQASRILKGSVNPWVNAAFGAVQGFLAVDNLWGSEGFTSLFSSGKQSVFA